MNRVSLLPLCLALLAGVADAGTRSVHVFVALADNKSQGIVPVPKKLGNGDDPRNNLYWGALYGVKAYFRRSDNWSLLSTIDNPSAGVLERCVFQHRRSQVVLIADAYRGAEIKRAITDFLAAAGGGNPRKLKVAKEAVPIHGGAHLVAYVGHNGLMEFSVGDGRIQSGPAGREAIVLACKSKQYFLPHLSRLKARPLLLTTGLMAPEAYTLEAALEAWVSGATGEDVRERAAAAYHKYQKCGLRAARRLFYSGGQ